MANKEWSRRGWLGSASAAVGVGMAARGLASEPAGSTFPVEKPFRYCLNTSTLSGQKLSLLQEVEVAARAGYQGLEPWAHELDSHVKGGGSLKDLGKRIRDNGLRVENVIAFFEWVVEDEARRRKGLEEARHVMDLVQQVGGRRVAAPPAGATNQADLPFVKVTERYRALLEVGAKIGVVPQVEVWGFSKTLGRLGEAAQVAIDSGHPEACVLADVFHLYKGGSGFSGLRLLSANALQVIHLNDYPAAPLRLEIVDAQRVYPGDGVAPLGQMFRDLRQIGFRGALSLELFNRDYWKQDAFLVARTGLEKLQRVVRDSLGTKP